MKGIDYEEIYIEIKKQEVHELSDSIDDTRALMKPENAPVFFQYLQAHIQHLEEHNIGNHSDYLPIYKELENIYAIDGENDYFSFYQIYSVLLPLMWC